MIQWSDGALRCRSSRVSFFFPPSVAIVHIVGIDFGTSSSAVAVSIDGVATLLEDRSGRSLLPTVVHVAPTGSGVVGTAARNRLNLAPERTFAGIKRLLGLRFDSDDAKQLARMFGWTLHRGVNDAAALLVDGKLWTAVDLAAEVFATLRETAAQRLDTASVHAVVTVPAGFTHAQRRAILDAADQGGISVERLLNEPTAAAIAYELHGTSGRKIAVFDLGGGTFDFTALEVKNDSFDVLSTTADAMLGSSDIDAAIAAAIADTLRAKHGIVVPDKMMPRLLPAAERMKIELSSRDSASAEVAAKWVGGTGNAIFHVEITRSELEVLARPLIARCMSCVRRGLSDGGIALRDIDDVVLVGGGTWMPLVRTMVTEFFGRRPLDTIDPERVVAIGAARWAETLHRRATTNAPVRHLLDRTAVGLGVGTVAGLVDYVIPPNAQVPARGIREFAASRDDVETLTLRIYQGTERRIDDCQAIGDLVLDNLPGGARGSFRVTVTFVLDAEGLVTISAVDSASGVSREAQLKSAQP